MARLIKGTHYLDIYSYELNDDGLILDHAMEYYDENKVVHLYDDVFPLKSCMFGGLELSCPSQPHKFLEIVYGKNVMIPKYKCVNSTWITAT